MAQEEDEGEDLDDDGDELEDEDGVNLTQSQSQSQEAGPSSRSKRARNGVSQTAYIHAWAELTYLAAYMEYRIHVGYPQKPGSRYSRR